MEQKKTDGQLWEDFKKGEKYALSYIYHLYVDALFQYGKKFSSDDDLIKDTIQDLFLDLIRTRLTLGPTDHIYFYLIKAFRRKLFRSISNSKDQQKIEEDSKNQDARIIYSIEDEWINKEQLSKRDEIIRTGLAKLSPKQREILYYRYTCDFEYDQICEIMSMKYDSARKMVFRALQTLREHVSETNISFFIIHYQRLVSFQKNI